MNELVQRLSRKKSPVQLNRPNKTSKDLLERIELGYLHVFFSEVGTEIGIFLEKSKCSYAHADLDLMQGTIHIEGCITLNYEKVRCIVDVSLESMSGSGILQPVSQVEYDKVVVL